MDDIEVMNTENDIKTFLKRSRWLRGPGGKTENIWEYLDLVSCISVGKQRWDWAVFVRGKNHSFHYAKSYADIPQTLVEAVMGLLQEYDLVLDVTGMVPITNEDMNKTRSLRKKGAR